MPLNKIVIVGKQPELYEIVRPFTKQLFAAEDINEAWSIIDFAEPDVVLCDHNHGRESVCRFLAEFSEKKFGAPVVVLAEADADRRDEYLKMGANDCICPKTEIEKLADIVEHIKNPAINTENDTLDRYFHRSCHPDIKIVGTSKATERTLKMIELVANSRCNPILIIGQTGTGKELVAKAIHITRHKDRKFVAINCAALTANLLESELFGHCRGAFTGADKEKVGLFALAEDGTIFLDEISEMPTDLQAKLLRVLQERTFRKVGGVKDIQCRATIIASSNRNLLKEVSKKKFRRDLYYRLSVCPITLSPLKSNDRKEDIAILADYFIKTSSICPEKKGRIKSLTKLAAESLLKHDWPGNVRELKNVIDRAVLLETTDKIGLSNLVLSPEQIMGGQIESAASSLRDFSLEKAEKELIARALKETNWQKTRAASLLGITRATLYAKVKQYNISPAPAEIGESAAVGAV